MLHLGEVAVELSRRLCRIFLRGEDGHRPVFGESSIEQEDPHFRDNLLFYEFFHGDTGRGLGAAHQTGWTALIALMLHFSRRLERLRPRRWRRSADLEPLRAG
jgi:hypothetical protein